MTLLQRSLWPLLVITMVVVFTGVQASPVLAQTGVQGNVIDQETGETLPGATVQIEEIERGVTTDPDGRFVLEGIDPGTYALRASFVGYRTVEQTVEIQQGQMTEVTIELSPSVEALDEVIVTGYEARQRREVTGAITSVSGEDFRTRAIQTPDQALQGSSAGLNLVGASGQPGSASTIRIRGTGSIDAGNDPLFIIDGVRLTEDSFTGGALGSFNPLQTIDPNDIESIEVLRDAEATAIYGAQGANGVVLVTTRSGEAGPTQVRFSSSVLASEQPNFYDLMTSPEWINYKGEARGNRQVTLGGNFEDGIASIQSDFGAPEDAETFDWQREMTQTGVGYRANLSILGGDEQTRFYVSGNYHDQEGTTAGSDFTRYQLRANLDHDITDRLNLDLRSNLSFTNDNNLVEDGNFITSPFHGGITIRPMTPIFDEDGNFDQGAVRDQINYNPLQVAVDRERNSRTMQGIVAAQASYDLTNTLRLTTQGNVDYRSNRDRDFQNPVIPQYQASTGGQLFESTREVVTYGGNARLNYSETFQDVHNVRGLIGGEYERMWRERHTATGREFPSQFFQTLQNAAVDHNVNGSQSEYKLAGFFGNARYNYDQRYFVSASLRTDGHSRFGEDRRWGTFWSGSLGWDIAQESFMDEVRWVNQLRPRVSHGITGNSSISNFASRNLYGSGGTYRGQQGLQQTQLGVADLTWEQGRDTDLALDVVLYGGRVDGTIGVYRSDSERLLLDRFLPSDSGFDEITENSGVVRNEGLEFEVNTIPLDTDNVTWRSDFNVTFQRSEVLELIGDQEEILSGNQTIRVGEERSMWWMYEYAGANPGDGRPMFRDENGNLTYTIRQDDRRLVGSPLPSSFGGWRNSVTVGPFEVSALAQFEFGREVASTTYHAFLMAPWRGRGLTAEMLERWQQPGDVTHIPLAYTSSSIRGASSFTASSRDFRLDDASYISLRNVQVVYNLPERLIGGWGMSGASIFAQAENLHTWSGYRGLDPEQVSEFAGAFPQPRTFTFGLEIGF